MFCTTSTVCRTKGALLATFVGVKAARAPDAPEKGAAPGPPHSGTCGNSNGALLACTWPARVPKHMIFPLNQACSTRCGQHPCGQQLLHVAAPSFQANPPACLSPVLPPACATARCAATTCISVWHCLPSHNIADGAHPCCDRILHTREHLLIHAPSILHRFLLSDPRERAR